VIRVPPLAFEYAFVSFSLFLFLLQKIISPTGCRTAKYFGSGVIIATAFIHLLASGVSELSSPCLSPAWQEYVRALPVCPF
jgi:zinc transporter 1/2/3